MATEIQATGAAATAIGTQLTNDLPRLQNGSKSEGVRFLQQLLILRYGYDIDFNADFGNGTERAVRDFQENHNLTSDGIVGINTWRALGADIGC
ncbi:MAG: peptidoglycan-binding protein [Scytonema sp. RU_4_4]|nr:peptidoglycan-binding protein [Scytonema sp. RU_4_4]NJR72820.1 peptidoglycan-binding protein [Scytonema sp. CRU_2_7]